MDKLFTPNKWFVLFCAVFIGIFATLQCIINTRLQAVAKEVGEDIFSWVWLDRNLCAKADMTDAKVIHRSENDAVVEVSGEQVIGAFEELKAGVDGNAQIATPKDANSTNSNPHGKPNKHQVRPSPSLLDPKTEKSSCKAVLTFYKQANDWKLGKVELR